MHICATVMLTWCATRSTRWNHITNIREIAILYGFEWKFRKSCDQFIMHFYKKQSCPTEVFFGPCFFNTAPLNFTWSYVIQCQFIRVSQPCALPKLCHGRMGFSVLPKMLKSFCQKLTKTNKQNSAWPSAALH